MNTHLLNPSVISKPLRRLFFPALLGSVLLAGCATMGGTYAEDKGDVCAIQRGELRRTEDYFVKQGAMNVLGGAAVGAASGAIISALTGGNVGQSAAIGAAAGAGAGLLKTLIENVVNENQQIDLTTNAFNNLAQCRFNAAEQVRTEFRANRLSAPAANQKMTELKVRFTGDIAIANRIGAKISARSQQFQDKLVKEDPAVQPYLATAQMETANQDSVTAGAASIDSEQTADAKPRRSAKTRRVIHKSANPGTLHNAVLASQKTAAKSMIQSPESQQAAEATRSNIVKSKQYNETVKSAAAKEDFQLEGQVGLLLPNAEKVAFFSITGSAFYDAAQPCSVIDL